MWARWWLKLFPKFHGPPCHWASDASAILGADKLQLLLRGSKAGKLLFYLRQDMYLSYTPEEIHSYHMPRTQRLSASWEQLESWTRFDMFYWLPSSRKQNMNGRGYQQGNKWSTFAFVLVKVPSEANAIITCVCEVKAVGPAVAVSSACGKKCQSYR